MNAKDIDELIAKHLMETASGIVNVPVNELIRGEATVRDYFIMKIDLVGSTPALLRNGSRTYVRLAHTYLSTVDGICREHGADQNQTEYQGDSVLAFFPERGNSAEAALVAAIMSHYVVRRMRQFDDALGKLDLKARVVLHHGSLNVANIGPYGESHRVAIGIPIHMVAKREKLVAPGTIWVSDDFAKMLDKETRRDYLGRNYRTEIRREQVAIPPPPPPPPTHPYGLLSALANYSAPTTNDLGSLFALGQPSQPQNLFANLPPPAQVTYEWRDVEHKVPDGWFVRIVPAYRAVKLSSG